MGFSVLLLVIKRFFLFNLPQDSKQYSKEFAKMIFSGESRKVVKALV